MSLADLQEPEFSAFYPRLRNRGKTSKITIDSRRVLHSLQTAPFGLAVFDSENTLLDANPAYLAFFDELGDIAPGVNYARILQLLSEEGTVNTQGRTGPQWCRYMLKQRENELGKPLVLRLWNGRYLRQIDSIGSAGDVISLLMDATDDIKHAKNLTAAVKSARKSVQQGTEAVTKAAHELRAPLAGIQGIADQLRQTDLSGDQRNLLDIISTSAESLSAMTADLLDIGHLAHGQFQIRNDPFDITMLVRDVLTLAGPAAATKSLRLKMSFAPDMPTRYLGDPVRLRQILSNLVDNAIKFTQSGEIRIQVAPVQLANTGSGRLEILVSDTGRGIKPRKQDRVFEAFQRDGKNSGSGLGLSIARMLINALDGEIWVESQPGVGSTFGISLPLAREDSASPTEPSARATERVHARQMKILVVEDDTTNQLVLERMLESLAVTTRFVYAGEEAVAILNDFSPDLVLMDLELPGMNGEEAAQLIRDKADALDHTVQILAYSAHMRPNKGSVFERSISKPIRKSDLTEAIKSACPAHADSPFGDAKPVSQSG